MKKIILLITLCAFNTVLFAQRDNLYSNAKVKFCTELDDDQYPDDPGSVFYISSSGSWIYVWIGNDRSLSTSQLIVDIYRRKGSDYTEFVETKYYDITPSWSDTHFKYTFYTPGDYKISVYSKDKSWISSGYVTIKSNSDNSSSSNNTDYFANSKVKFCTELDSNQYPDDPGSVFYIGSGGSWVYIWVGNDKSFSTSQLVVDIYRKKGGDYSEFVETKYYDITPSWSDTHFKYTFYKAGDYKVSVYNKDNKWINTGYVTIKYQ